MRLPLRSLRKSSSITHLPDKNKDEPEPTRDQRHEGVEEELEKPVVPTTTVIRHYFSLNPQLPEWR